MVNAKIMATMVTAAAVLIACLRDPDPAVAAPTSGGASVKANAELVLVIDARDPMPTSYTVVWKAQVRKVASGKLADREIYLRLDPNDQGELYGGHFRYGEVTEEKAVTVRLRRTSDVPRIGFTAADGARWELVKIEGKQ